MIMYSIFENIHLNSVIWLIDAEISKLNKAESPIKPNTKDYAYSIGGMQILFISNT